MIVTIVAFQAPCATIEAINSGWEVYGIDYGFEDIMRGSVKRVHRLLIEDVTLIKAGNTWQYLLSCFQQPSCLAACFRLCYPCTALGLSIYLAESVRVMPSTPLAAY